MDKYHCEKLITNCVETKFDILIRDFHVYYAEVLALAQAYLAAMEEIKRLWSICDSLPVTEDGVPYIPLVDTRTFWAVCRYEGEPLQVSPCRVSCDADELTEGRWVVPDMDLNGVMVSVWSTHEAAEAAIGEIDG